MGRLIYVFIPKTYAYQNYWLYLFSIKYVSVFTYISFFSVSYISVQNFENSILKIPNYLSCQLKFQDGSTHEYCVPTVKVQSYTLEEIKEKHLCLLIPFLPIRFRRSIPSDAKIQSASSPDEHRSLEKRLQKSKEELTSFFAETILILDQEIADGFLTETDKHLILSLLKKPCFEFLTETKTYVRRCTL